MRKQLRKMQARPPKRMKREKGQRGNRPVEGLPERRNPGRPQWGYRCDFTRARAHKEARD